MSGLIIVNNLVCLILMVQLQRFTNLFFLGVPCFVRSLVFEYVANTDFRVLYDTFTSQDIKYYCYQILKVRQNAHLIDLAQSMLPIMRYSSPR